MAQDEAKKKIDIDRFIAEREYRIRVLSGSEIGLEQRRQIDKELHPTPYERQKKIERDRGGR